MESEADRKAHGKVYTPPEVVDHMLDMVFERWKGGHRTFCDPACGDGAFLVPLAERILALSPLDQGDRHRLCDYGQHEFETERGRIILLRGIAGFDRDPEALAECGRRLDEACMRHAVTPPEWNLQCMDALDEVAWKKWEGKFDFVVGNPPYVHVQNLEESRRARIRDGSWEFMDGASDLYMLFIEAGLRLLSGKGTLNYITPSSWMKSAAGGRVPHCRPAPAQGAFGPRLRPSSGLSRRDRLHGDRGNIQEAFGRRRHSRSFAHGQGNGFQGGEGGLRGPFLALRGLSRHWMTRSISGSAPTGRASTMWRTSNIGVQTLADSVFILTETEARDEGIEDGAVRPIVKVSRLGSGDPPQVAVFPYTDRAGN